MEKKKQSPCSVIENEISIFVRRAEAARIANLMHKEMDRSTYLLLRLLDSRGALGIKSIAEVLQLDISTVSRQISALEAKGYVTRLVDPNDARVNLLQLTPDAPQALAEVRKAREAFYEQLLEEWTEQEREQFGTLLRKFNETAQKKSRASKGSEK